MKNLLIAITIASVASLGSASLLSQPDGKSKAPFKTLTWGAQNALSESTKRVWVCSDAAVASGSTVAIITGDYTTGFAATQISGTNIYYADMLANAIESKVGVCNASGSYSEGGSFLVVTFNSGTVTVDKSIKILNYSESTGYVHASYSYPSSVTVELAAKVLEGCHTCVDDDDVGYGVTQDFITNYYSKLSETDQATFNATVINDIEYTDSEKTTTQATTTTCGKKLAQMKANAGIKSASTISANSSLSENASIWVIAGIAAAVIASSAVAVIAKSKKKKEN